MRLVSRARRVIRANMANIGIGVLVAVTVVVVVLVGRGNSTSQLPGQVPAHATCPSPAPGTVVACAVFVPAPRHRPLHGRARPPRLSGTS